jgi:hypothetical protein
MIPTPLAVGSAESLPMGSKRRKSSFVIEGRATESERVPGNQSLSQVVDLFGSPSLTRTHDPLVGIDSNGNDSFPLSSRPLGFGCNSFKTPTLANLDFRVLKYFPFGETAKLDVVAEAFNLFNRANVAQINPVFGPGPTALLGFLQPLTALGARRIQFSLDFEF